METLRSSCPVVLLFYNFIFPQLVPAFDQSQQFLLSLLGGLSEDLRLPLCISDSFVGFLFLLSVGDGGRKDIGSGGFAGGLVDAPGEGDGGSVEGVVEEALNFDAALFERGCVAEEVP